MKVSDIYPDTHKDIDFVALMPLVAQRLLGEPNVRFSKLGDLRFRDRGSISIKTKDGTFYDHEAKIGGGLLDFIVHYGGCSTHAEAVDWLRREGLLDDNIGTNKPPVGSSGANAPNNGTAKPLHTNGSAAANHPQKSRAVAKYDYLDECGKLLFRVVRCEPKDFRQCRPNGSGGWIWGLDKTRRVLYRLPELIKAVADKVPFVCIVEGEKDVDNVRKFGITATTCPMGVNKWDASYNEYLRGANVVLLPDNDEPGRKHMKTIAAGLRGVASRTRVVDLVKHWPACPPKADVSDWIAAGGTLEQLVDMAEATADWSPAAQTADTEAETAAEAPRPLMRDMPSADQFPVDALGPALASAARAIQDRVQAPMAICGQSVLAAATLAVQGYADVKLPIGQVRPISEYFLTIARSGERKTAADAEALRSARKHEADLRGQYELDLPSYLNMKVAYEKARDVAAKSCKGDMAKIKAALDQLGPAPVAPLSPILTCQEPTFEGLCKLAIHGRASLGVFSSEGGQFIAGHGMSADHRLKTAAGLSAFWDGDEIKRVRSGDGATTLVGRRVSVHLMAQPDVAALWLADPLLIEQGLLSRCLVSAPDSTAGTRFQHDEKNETQVHLDAYRARLDEIFAANLPLADGKQNELAPRVIELSQQAAGLWRGFADHVERMIGPGGALEPVRGLANKLPEHAARLAGVLTLVDDLAATEILTTHMQAGIQLAQHYAAEALRLHETSRVSDDLIAAQKLLAWLRGPWGKPVVSLPNIYQKGPNSIRDKATAKKLVGILEEHGHMVRLQAGADIDGQHRREAWRVLS